MHHVSDFSEVVSQAEGFELDFSESALKTDLEDGFQFILLGCQQSFGVFFKSFIFVFSLQKYKLVFRYIFTITIYHLSPTFWQRCDPALVEVLGFFIKELDKFRFDIAFVLELFIT